MKHRDSVHTISKEINDAIRKCKILDSDNNDSDDEYSNQLKIKNQKKRDVKFNCDDSESNTISDCDVGVKNNTEISEGPMTKDLGKISRFFQKYEQSQEYNTLKEKFNASLCFLTKEKMKELTPYDKNRKNRLKKNDFIVTKDGSLAQMLEN